MAYLCVNIDHIATLRQARRELDPDPVAAAMLAELAGAHGITVHLREDRRHIQDRDVRALREAVRTKLNLEMAATAEMVGLALAIRPDEVTLVPEKRAELTTEGGLAVRGQEESLRPVVRQLRQAGITVSLFIDANADQIHAAHACGADFIELHTGAYAAAAGAARNRALLQLQAGAELAAALGLGLNAGHGLTYANVAPVARLFGLVDLNIGHNIIARAALVGLDRAVRDMLALVA
jgi:pyridoxine 5-phosphate synthase